MTDDEKRERAYRTLDAAQRERERNEAKPKRPAKRSRLTPVPVREAKPREQRAPIAHADEVGRVVVFVLVALFWVWMAASCGITMGPGGSLS